MIFFIAIIAAIAIELSFRRIEQWRGFAWFTQFTDWVVHRFDSSSVRDGPVVVLAILAPLLFAIWLVSAMLGGVWNLFDFVFSVLVLVLSLGPADPLRQTQDYLDALQNDDGEAAKSHASSLLGREADENPVLVAEHVKQSLLIKICSSIIGVFIWFIVLGPIGAAMFRFSCLLKERYDDVQTGFAKSVKDLYNILMWVPARITVLCFAIIGNFVDVIQSLQKVSDLWQADSDALLSETGVGALHEPDLSDDDTVNKKHVHDCLLLAKRTLLAFLTFLAIFVIVSWIF